MKIKNTKGFTLVELIIAMSIFTVVIGLGYGILNKISLETKNQSVLTSNHLNVNLINKYVTKDLEQCKVFVGPKNANVGSNYEFAINEGDEEIKYKVSIISKGSKEYYSLTRKYKGNEIDLVENQPKISKTPFFIHEKEGKDNLFIIQVDNSKESSRQYKFEVSSRLIASSDNVEPPINVEDGFKEWNKASFRINDSVNNNVNIGIFNEGNKNNENFNVNKQVDASSDSSYGMNMFLDFGNSGNGKNDMELSNIWDKISGNFQTPNYNKENEIKIVIVVGSKTKFNIKEVKINSESNILIPNISKNTVLESGSYTYILKNVFKPTLEITGDIIKEGSDSFVNIYYGKGK